MIPKISVTGLGDYTRNVGYKTGSITFDYENKAFGYDHGIRLLADVMDVEEAGVFDCLVQAGAELERTQVAPEADAFTYAAIASHEGVSVTDADLSKAKATDVLAALRSVTNAMDEAQVPPAPRRRRPGSTPLMALLRKALPFAPNRLSSAIGMRCFPNPYARAPFMPFVPARSPSTRSTTVRTSPPAS